MVEAVDNKQEKVEAQDGASTTTKDTADVGASGATDAYAGDLGDIEYTFVRDVDVEPKVVPTFTYGRRVRIAALF